MKRFIRCIVLVIMPLLVRCAGMSETQQRTVTDGWEQTASP
jgi:hypothetical protein